MLRVSVVEVVTAGLCTEVSSVVVLICVVEDFFSITAVRSESEAMTEPARH